MKLEDQVISLEFAKKMKELGFEQESLWEYRYLLVENPGALPTRSKEYKLFLSDKEETTQLASAYTVAELGEMLRKNVQGLWESYWNVSRECFCVHYRAEGLEPNTLQNIPFDGDTEANARAKLLIYLKENNLHEDNTL